MKDRRLTQKQIDRLLANNPHKITVEPEPQEPVETVLRFQGIEKQYDTLNSDDQIKVFCEFIRNVCARYDENTRQIEEAEAMENDIRHCIELAQKLTEKEKKYLYDKLTDVLQLRRACKSENEILQPLYLYFNDKTLLNKLAQLQGTVANIKEIITNRTYSCRTSVLENFRNTP
jgi:hypothetical protein